MKKLLCLLLSLIFVLSLASCKQKEVEEPDMEFPKVSSGSEPSENPDETSANQIYKREITMHTGVEGISSMINEYSGIETTSCELIMGDENATADIQMFMLSVSLYDMMLYPFFSLDPQPSGDNTWTAVTDEKNNIMEISKTGNIYNFFATAVSTESYDDESEKYLFYVGSFNEDTQMLEADIYEGDTTDFSTSQLTLRFECMNHELGYLSQFAIFNEPGADDGIYLKGVFNEENCYVSMSPLSYDVFTSFDEMNIVTPRSVCNLNYDFAISENGKIAYNINE